MKTIDLVGKTFGKLTVTKISNERGARGQIKWDCICSCGNAHTVTGESLRHGKSKSCGCLLKVAYNKNGDREYAVYKQLYKSSILKRANHINKGCDMSLDEFIEMSKQPCFYCGKVGSNFASDRFGTNRRKTSDTTIHYNGLDRIDSSIGYLKSNVVTCCKHCNIAKSTMSQVEFAEWVTSVFTHYCKVQPQ